MCIKSHGRIHEHTMEEVAPDPQQVDALTFTIHQVRKSPTGNKASSRKGNQTNVYALMQDVMGLTLLHCSVRLLLQYKRACNPFIASTYSVFSFIHYSKSTHCVPINNDSVHACQPDTCKTSYLLTLSPN